MSTQALEGSSEGSGEGSPVQNPGKVKHQGAVGGAATTTVQLRGRGGVNLRWLRASAGSEGGRMRESTSIVHVKHHIYDSKIYNFFPCLKESINSEKELFKVFLIPLKQI